MVNQSRPAASPESSTVRMWGCCSRAASRISRWKRSGPSVGGQLGVQHLEGDRPVVPEVLREVDRRHAAAPELALDRVAAGQRALQLLAKAHGVPAISRRKRGLPLSGAKLGSIRSQPGERKYGILSSASSWSIALSGSPATM